MPDKNSPSRDTPSRTDLLDEVVARYLRAIETSENPSRDELLARHPTLANELREFFADHDRMNRMAAPLCEPTLDMPVEPPIAETPGTQIGPYKLLQQIGQGGMGVVYMAEQATPIRRKVALKIIKPGMDTREVIARFEAERQALALMDHPNIARVFDGGATQAGRPYFVMELVRGVPITDYCDQNNLPVHERLELFVTVCRAVQHAHQKGIIHRDIKPSNVLVTLHDSRPVPKVIDFGVAKAIGQQLTDKTLFTQFAQMVGTPLYMSPEQAEQTGQDVDTRGDIYSLGVLLYELLTGTTPLERGSMQKAGINEIRRMIREDDPPSPSMRLSSIVGATQTAVAAHRRVDPRGLSRLVRGDLDWIVMKALEKDRNRRYETANGFAADIGRYLSDDPVEACPPSAAYRFRKFVRRNRAGLVTASLLGVALLVVTSAIGWTIRDRSAQRAEMERQRETQQLEAQRERKARQAKLEGRISEALDEMRAAYERDNLPEAIAAVKHAERLLASDDVGHDELRERVRHWQGELDAVQRLENLAFQFSRERSVETDAAYAMNFRELGIDVDELPVAEAGKRIRSHVTWQRLTEALDQWSATRNERAWLERSRADKSESEANEVFERGMVRKRRVLQVARAADVDDLRSRVRLAVETWDITGAELLAASSEVSRLSATTLRQLAMVVYYGGGNSRRESAVRVLENAQSQRPGDFRLSYVCAIYCEQMEPPRLAEAAHYWSIALAIRPADAWAQGSLAHVYSRQGKVDEAIAGYRRAIELDPKQTGAHHNLGGCLTEQGKLDEAIACFRLVIELDPKMALAHGNLGRALMLQEKSDAAIACYRQAIELDPKFAWCHRSLGIALKQQGKLDEAIACYRRALELDPKSTLSHFNLGAILQSQGNLDEAIACYRQALELDPKMAPAHSNLGLLLAEQGKLDEAITCFRRAVEFDPKLALYHNNLGGALKDQGKPDEAIACFRQALELDPKSVKAHCNLGATLQSQGNLDEAIACFRQAIELNPKSALAHCGLGVTLNAQGKAVEAIICYRRAITLDPKYALAHTNLGIVLKEQGKLEEAMACYRQSIDLDPKLAPAHYNLAVTLNIQGKRGEAIVCYRRAIELDPNTALVHNDLGVALNDQGNLGEAIAWYRQAIDLDPRSAIARYNLGAALRDQGKPDEAIACYVQAIDLDPKYAPAHRNLGTALADRGDLDEAIACYRQVIELEPKSALAHGILGSALADQGKLDEAIHCYRRAIELNPAAWEEFVNKFRGTARIAESEKAFGPLIAVYQKLAQANPTSSSLTQELAQLLISAERVPDTLALWEKLVDKSSSHDDYQLHLGYALWELADRSSAAGRHSEAEKTLRRAVDVFEKLGVDFPGKPFYRVEQGYSHWKLAWLMKGLGRLRGAEEPIRQALAVYKQLAADYPQKPDYRVRLSQTYNSLAELLVLQGRHAEGADELDNAAAEYTKTIELAPDAWEAWNGRAFVHFQRQQWDKAIADFSKAIDLAPQAHTNWWHRGHAYSNLAQWDKAAADFGTVVDQWPDGAEGWFRRALALAQLNEPDRALADLRQAIARGFKNVEMMKTYSQLEPLRTREDFRALLKEFERQAKSPVQQNVRQADTLANFSKVLELEPNDVAALKNRAKSFIDLGLWPEAAADYARAYELGEPADGMAFLHHALLRRCVEDGPGYRDACQRMLARFAGSTDAEDWLRIAIVLGYAPEPVVEPARIVSFAERAVADNKTVWRVAYLGLAYFRAGQFERAAAALEESLTIDPNWNPAAVSAALALVQHRLEDGEKASAALDKARIAREERVETMLKREVGFWPTWWWDVVHGELLYREAYALIHGSPLPEDPRLVLLRGRALGVIGRGDEAITAFLAAIKLEPHNSSCFYEIRTLICDRADAAHRPALIERVDRELPDSFCRPDWSAMRGSWQEALAGMIQRIERNPQDHYPWYQAASLYAQLGDVAAYRRHCREMLSRFGKTRDPAICEHVAKACLLLAATADELELPRQLASRAVALAPQHDFVAYYELAQALAEYRAGEFAGACDSLDRYLARQKAILYGIAIAQLLQAMSRFQQRDVDEARQLFDKAIQYCDGLPQTSKGQLLYWDWHDGIAVDLVRREAEKLFMKNVPSIKRSKSAE